MCVGFPIIQANQYESYFLALLKLIASINWLQLSHFRYSELRHFVPCLQNEFFSNDESGIFFRISITQAVRELIYSGHTKSL